MLIAPNGTPLEWDETVCTEEVIPEPRLQLRSGTRRCGGLLRAGRNAGPPGSDQWGGVDQRPGGRAVEKYWKDISALLAGDFSNASRRVVVGSALWHFVEGPGRENKYRGCRYWSRGAIDDVAAKGMVDLGKRMRHDYAVPRGVFVAHVLALPCPTPEDVRRAFEALAVGCVVTPVEQRLLDLRHRRAMPDGWLTAGPGGTPDVWARYARVGVEPVGPLRWEGRTAFSDPTEAL